MCSLDLRRPDRGAHSRTSLKGDEQPVFVAFAFYRLQDFSKLLELDEARLVGRVPMLDLVETDKEIRLLLGVLGRRNEGNRQKSSPSAHTKGAIGDFNLD